MSLTSII